MVLKNIRRVLEFGRVYGIFPLCVLFLVLIDIPSVISYPYCHCSFGGFHCEPVTAALVHPTRYAILVSLLTGIEALVFFAIVRPRSYRRSWGRAMLALALFASWALLLITLPSFLPWTWWRFLFFPDLPSRDFYLEHLLWLFLVVCILALVVVVTLSGLAFDRLRELRRGGILP